ncbi:glycosyltransferase [Methanobacterium sp. SMA-27]|uniref:glycosyltransferase n=1 Tax=Methanobacterium sp. SMA-27 TaxID=1495336 RepID=UPI00064EDEE2|nr:glycosyltransferase [Methanobacterium sp. SMA-27]
MKILQVSQSFYPCFASGGVARVVYEVSKELVAMGHEVTVYTTDGCIEVTPNNKHAKNIEGLKVYYFKNISKKIKSKFQIANPFYLPIIARKEIKNYDIIHIHEHRTILAVIICYYAKKSNIPYIIQAHGSVMPIFQKTNLKKFFDRLWGYNILKNASKVIALTNTELEQYKKMGVNEEKIDIIPNGINLSILDQIPEKGKFRQKYSINENEKIILYLGRIHKRKGIDILLNAFPDISDNLSHVKLVIVGPDDGFLKTIENQSKTLIKEGKVIITGPLYDEEKWEAYTDADVLVYPAIHEIFGLVPFEAILCDTSVVVTKNDGCGELVEKVNCGNLVEYGDTQGLIDVVSYIFKNLDKQSKLIENGKKYIINNLNWEKIASEVEKVYENCIRNL